MPVARPLFSICIPQWERLPFLLAALDSVTAQTLRDFEICVSDDRSPSGGQERIVEQLERAGVDYAVAVMCKNGRYDVNLRSAIGLSRGQYIFLLGNDDALKDVRVLERCRDLLAQHPNVGAAFCNHEDFATGRVNRTTPATANRGHGVGVAVANYRNFAFVSGVLFDGDQARALATDAYDGTEMYQIHLASSIVASGRDLLAIDDVMIRKDIRIAGERVESYVTNAAKEKDVIAERRMPVALLGQLVCNSVAPYMAPGTRDRWIRKVFRQLYLFIYGYWFVEYRRVKSWKFTVGMMLGVRPSRSLKPLKPGLYTRVSLGALFACVAVAALLTPIRLFDSARPALYRLAKRQPAH
ncbi:MAG TPA: glycosyltransferase family 2 protein [Dyella sp.]|uniref:glycosyltransferase family 2 protein n=1 Tax=Dyella sp. TaxID=1869338 RepID=UPI002D795EB2|nr:glycosyltransferase family 2 protein [Dyella sp.]HET6553603.1 glycosyltransferase family 2 protein [Dyella sp.]